MIGDRIGDEVAPARGGILLHAVERKQRLRFGAADRFVRISLSQELNQIRRGHRLRQRRGQRAHAEPHFSCLECPCNKLARRRVTNV